MTEPEVLELFRSSNALLEGHFQLSSGLHSDRYIQCALVLQYPEWALQLGAALGGMFQDVLPVSGVVAPAIGGILVAHEVARALDTRALFTERVNHEMTLRRGFSLQPADRVIVVEDVLTTGLSTHETMQAIERAGGQVVGVGALIDRRPGEASSPFSVPIRSLAKLGLQSYAANDCPLCQKKIPVVKPGSRI